MASRATGRPIRRRTAGEGGIDRLRSGKWRTRFRGPDGRRHSATFATRADAASWLAKQQVRTGEGGWIDPKAGRVLLADYAASWLAGRTDLRPSTIGKYRHLLGHHILPSLGGFEVGRLLPSAVRD